MIFISVSSSAALTVNVMLRFHLHFTLFDLLNVYLTVLLSLRKVLVLEESPFPRGPIYKSLTLSLSLSLDNKVLESCRGLSNPLSIT